MVGPMTKNGRNAEREERLAKALRANLARRKAQARARREPPGESGADRVPPSAGPDAQKPQGPKG
jgi:hypothetical protein